MNYNNLLIFQLNDRVGVQRNENGNVHFFVNGRDQGWAASNVPEVVYGVIDLYGQVAQVRDWYFYYALENLFDS